MTATYRLKGLGWLAISVIVVLGFYMVSLRVSVERKRLETVDSQIAQADHDIRTLQTEFATRANLAQLEQWNGQVLALAAPTPAQYLSSGQALASLAAGDQPGQATVETAQLVIPTLPVMAPAPDAARDDTSAVAPTSPAHQPTATPVRVAAIKPAADRVSAAVKDAVSHAAAPVRRALADGARGEAMAMLDRKLLSDSTLGDLTRGARAETASLR
jgi:hypothetical protein